MERQSARSLQHAAAFLLSELSDALCAWSAVLPHFATSISIQVVGSQRTDTISHLNRCPPVGDLKPESEKKRLGYKIEVKPVCKSASLWTLGAGPPSF